MSLLDRATLLRRFSGVIEAAETDLKTSISSRREYLVEKYGPDPAAAFMNADPLDLPRAPQACGHSPLTEQPPRLAPLPQTRSYRRGKGREIDSFHRRRSLRASTIGNVEKTWRTSSRLVTPSCAKTRPF